MTPLDEYFPQRPIRLKFPYISWRSALSSLLLGVLCLWASIGLSRAAVTAPGEGLWAIAFILLAVCCFWAVGHDIPRRIRDVQNAALKPTPIAVQFRNRLRCKHQTWFWYTWTDPKTGQSRGQQMHFGIFPREPFWLDGEHKTMLALASPTGKAYLLDAKLDFTDLTPEERRVLFQLAPAAKLGRKST